MRWGRTQEPVSAETSLLRLRPPASCHGLKAMQTGLVPAPWRPCWPKPGGEGDVVLPAARPRARSYQGRCCSSPGNVQGERSARTTPLHQLPWSP